MRSHVAILLVLAACSDGDGAGVPLVDGDAAGNYGDDAIDPRFAVAFTREKDGKLEIQFGENAISCSNHLHEGSGNPMGLFVRLILDADKATVGEHTGVWIEYDDLHRGGTHQWFSTSAKVTLDAIDDASVAGSVMHMGTDTELGTLTFNGSFVVTRCP